MKVKNRLAELQSQTSSESRYGEEPNETFVTDRTVTDPPSDELVLDLTSP